MTQETIQMNALNPLSKNGVSYTLNEGQALNILTRSYQLQREAKRAKFMSNKIKDKEIKMCWAQREYELDSGI